MTLTYVSRDLWICVPWLIFLILIFEHSYSWHVPFIYVKWFIYTCEFTYWYVWHDLCLYVTWLIHMCDLSTHTHTRTRTHTHTTNTHTQTQTHTNSLSHTHIHTSGFSSCVMYIDQIWHEFFTCVALDKLWRTHSYGVATISRLLKIVGPFCKRAL